MNLQIDTDELMELTKGMIAIPSVSGDEENLAKWLVAWCEERGIQAELQYAAPGRPNVIARVRGRVPGAKSLLFNGHIDMTEPLEIYEGDPYEPVVTETEVRGGGVSNMKGAVAAMFATLAAAQRVGGLDGELILTAVVGECDQLGLGTKAALAAGIRADAAINGEPTGMTLQLYHSGVFQFEVTFKGHPAHQNERDRGINAIYRAMSALEVLKEENLTFEPHKYLGAPQMMIGMISGGFMPQITAPHCSIRGDIRQVPGMTKQSIVADLKRMIESVLPADAYELQVHVHSDPFDMDLDADICRSVLAAHREVTGVEVVVPTERFLGATDCSHLQAAGIPTALYGPATFQMNETYDLILIEELNNAAKVYLEAARRFTAA